MTEIISMYKTYICSHRLAYDIHNHNLDFYNRLKEHYNHDNESVELYKDILNSSKKSLCESHIAFNVFADNHYDEIPVEI